MLVVASPTTKRTSSAAELVQEEGVPKKPRTGDPPLDGDQATLLSEPIDVNPAFLRQELPTTSQAQMPQTTSKPPKGRRRFMADLEELKSAELSLHNHCLHSKLKSPAVSLGASTYVSPQDCAPGMKKDLSSLPSTRRMIILSLSISSLPVRETPPPPQDRFLLIALSPDTSDYPENHQFYAFALEADGLPDHVTTVIQSIADRPSRTLQETIRRLFFDLARVESQDDTSEEDGSEEDDLDGDLDYGYDTGVSQPTRFEIGQLRK